MTKNDDTLARVIKMLSEAHELATALHERDLSRLGKFAPAQSAIYRKKSNELIDLIAYLGNALNGEDEVAQEAAKS